MSIDATIADCRAKFRSRPEVRNILQPWKRSRIVEGLTGSRGQPVMSFAGLGPLGAFMMKLIVQGYILSHPEEVGAISAGALDSETKKSQGHSLFHILDESPVYLFTEEMLFIAQEFPIEPHVFTPESFPLPSMFWVFENPQPLSCGGYKKLDTLGALAMTLGDRSAFILAGFDGAQPENAKSEIQFIPVEVRHGEVNTHCDFFLKILALLNSDAVETSSESPVTRQQRRHSTRNGGRVSPVRVMRLRRIAQPETSNAVTGHGSPKRRHWVQGHFRNQWHPSLKAHKVKYIAPHLRGSGEIIHTIRHVAR